MLVNISTHSSNESLPSLKFRRDQQELLLERQVYTVKLRSCILGDICEGGLLVSAQISFNRWLSRRAEPQERSWVFG
jgi:hypothetical protein